MEDGLDQWALGEDVFRRVRADHQGAVGEWREHRVDGGYGVRFVRLLADWEDEAGVAALCDGAADELDYVQYDSQGRVVSVVAPDGASTTNYLYQGNTTKVTSPSLKWKIHEVDVVGNLTKVTEPDALGGADFVTTYLYNDKNQLLTVT